MDALIDIDKNLDLDESDTSCEDEGLDAVEHGEACGSEALVRKKKIKASTSILPHYYNRTICEMQSYIAITSSTGGVYSVCQNCYFYHAINVSIGKHTHIHIHYKKALRCCEETLRCSTCQEKISQIVSPETCLVCNSGESQTIERHVIDRTNFD